MLQRMQGWRNANSLALWDTAALRSLDHDAAAGLPSHGLMQRAGDAIARLARARFAHAHRVSVLCGPGNNGGDGLVAAANLARHGLQVCVWMVACGDAADWQCGTRSKDWLWALGLAREAGLQLRPWPLDSPLTACRDAELIIDAMLGLGLNRAPRGELGAAIDTLQQHPAPILAVDLPSGLASDTGVAPGPLVRASVTLTLLGLKPGLLTGPDAQACGELWLDDLRALPASPRPIANTPVSTTTKAPAVRTTEPVTHPVAQPFPEPVATLLGLVEASMALPEVMAAAHKGERGDVYVFGGAAGMTGAALLGSRAALALGAGRVFTALLDPHAPSFDALRPELMLRQPQALLAQLQNLQASPARTCVVFGPGAGCDRQGLVLLQALLALNLPLVIDADGLNQLATQAPDGAPWQTLRQRTAPTWLTPHPRETAKLLQWDTANVQADRLAAARTLAAQSLSHCVLKGAGTVMATPDGKTWVNASGNGLLATAGSGDVLAGALAACVAPCRTEAEASAAARAAVWLHGAGADLAHEAGKSLRAGTLAAAMVRARRLARLMAIDCRAPGRDRAT